MKSASPSSQPAGDDGMTARFAHRLRQLRQERGWSLDRLAERSGVSRATLSRLENAAVSPTTEVLGRLCSAYSLTLSRLFAMVDEDFVPLVRRDAQPEWLDRRAGFRRRSVSPPARSLGAEVIECELGPGARLRYDAPSVPGLEHHLLLRDGGLEVVVDGRRHALAPGDCLRYRLFGPTEFRASAGDGARYVLVLAGG